MKDMAWLNAQKLKNPRCTEFFRDLEMIHKADNRKRLFHYTSVDNFIKILQTGKIKLSPYTLAKSRVKEILESKISIGTPIEILLGFYELMNKFGYACFISGMDDNITGSLSVLIMGRHSAFTKNVCLELDAEKIKLPNGCIYGNICYRDNYPIYPLKDTKIDSVKKMESYFKENAEQFLFFKRSCWNVENEYRIWGRKGQEIDISEAINSIYISSNDLKMVDSIRSHVKSGVPVTQICQGLYPSEVEPIEGLNSFFESTNMALKIIAAEDDFMRFHADKNHIFISRV